MMATLVQQFGSEIREAKEILIFLSPLAPVLLFSLFFKHTELPRVIMTLWNMGLILPALRPAILGDFKKGVRNVCLVMVPPSVGIYLQWRKWKDGGLSNAIVEFAGPASMLAFGILFCAFILIDIRFIRGPRPYRADSPVNTNDDQK